MFWRLLRVSAPRLHLQGVSNTREHKLMWIFIRFLFLVIPVIGLYHECIPGSLVWKKLIYIEQKGAGGSVVQACMYSFVFETPWRRLLGTKTCRSFWNLYEVCKHITCNCLWVDWLHILIGVEFRFICCFTFYLSSACVRPVTKTHVSPQPVAVSNEVWSERTLSR